MNAAQLRAFHAVAREGGFTAAARSIGLTQPAVTVQVRALEESYGVELFHRLGRGVRMTATGQELFNLTRRIFLLEHEADDFLRAEGGLHSGRVRIAADGPFHVITLIESIGQERPGLEVTVSIGNSKSVLSALVDYEAEIGILGEYSLDDRFAVLSVTRHPIMLMMPADHRWARRKSVDIHELHGLSMILRESGSGTRRSFETALANAGVTPHKILEIGSREAVREAVARGLGVAVIQEPELGHDSRVAATRIAGADITTDEAVICLQERRQSHLMRWLCDIVTQQATVRAAR